MKKNKILIILFFLIIFLYYCKKDNNNLSLAFTGDIFLTRGVNDQLIMFGDSLFINSVKILRNFDYSVINLENPLTVSKKIRKHHYNFKANPQKAKMLKKAGFSYVSIANNHIFDYSNEGYQETIRVLKENNLIPLGISSKPTVIRKGKNKCAILSASLLCCNDSLTISNEIELKQAVKEFKNKTSKVPLILYLHWGKELKFLPEKQQRKLAKELINLGADAIIGTHPHITQTMEFINGKPVFYSLGNFVADSYMPNTDLTYIVQLTVNDKISDINIIPMRLKHFFPKNLSLEDQIFDIKKHFEYSDVALIKKKNKWQIRPIKSIDFSEKNDLWIIAQNDAVVTIKKLKKDSYLINLFKDGYDSNVINLHGRLFGCRITDINNDGDVDVIVGISKSVHFDQNIKKRINIYTYFHNNLKRLWLGTSFIDEIENFEIISENNLNYLLLTELTKQLKNVKRIYEWDDFGFALKKELKDEKNY